MTSDTVTPLTDEQRALWVKWLPYTKKVAWAWLRRHPLFRRSEYQTEAIFAASAQGGLQAVKTWDPDKGTFVTWLHWCCLAEVQKEVRASSTLTLYSLDAPWRAPDGLDMPPLKEAIASTRPSPEAELEGARLLARAREDLTNVLVSRGKPREHAQRDVEAFLSLFLDGEYGDSAAMAREIGITRQAYDNRMRRIEKVFEAWARDIRNEWRDA